MLHEVHVVPAGHLISITKVDDHRFLGQSQRVKHVRQHLLGQIANCVFLSEGKPSRIGFIGTKMISSEDNVQDLLQKRFETCLGSEIIPHH